MTTSDEGWQARQDRLADERQREATAATLLAAILANFPLRELTGAIVRESAVLAVELADELRTTLKAKL
jgi:hypothetical protein